VLQCRHREGRRAAHSFISRKDAFAHSCVTGLIKNACLVVQPLYHRYVEVRIINNRTSQLGDVSLGSASSSPLHVQVGPSTASSFPYDSHMQQPSMVAKVSHWTKLFSICTAMSSHMVSSTQHFPVSVCEVTYVSFFQTTRMIMITTHQTLCTKSCCYWQIIY
jgi:hypothetical protein